MPQGANKGKKYTYIWVSLIVLIFGALTIPKLVNRLKKDAVVQHNRMANMANLPLAYITANGTKRKVPNFTFYNQDSVLVTTEDMLGKVYVLDFFFTSCPTICPKMTQNLKQIQKTFAKDQNFALLSITIDPKRDSAPRLRQYANQYEANTKNWHFLTGDKDRIYTLSNDGFYMLANENKMVPGGFEHSGLFALVDKQGYLRSRTDANNNPIIYYRGTVSEAQGVNDLGEVQQITILKEDIKKLLAE